MFQKHICILFTSILLGVGAFAQSPVVIAPMTWNPKLVVDETNQDKALYAPGSHYYFKEDTLSIPFVDDFSRDLFKDHRLHIYSGLYQDTLYVFKTLHNNTLYPDTVEYVFARPDSFVVTSPDTFATYTSLAPPIEIHIFDSVTNPYEVANIITAYKYIPKMVRVVNGIPQYSVDYNPDGILINRRKAYTIVPTSPQDKSIWVDRHVYINDGIAVKPPSIGVAVFDGINMKGMPYRHTPGARGVADYLTSKPLDLASYMPGDSVYLSFFIQPQGIGFEPQPRDSFVLEFKTPNSPEWKWVWSTRGSGVKPFQQIMIPLVNNEWFVKGFQFRFKNYAGLNMNSDHWLLDYVRLDSGRSKSDTLIDDVTFITRAPSILLNYEQMPAHQFKQSEINQKVNMESANLSAGLRWVSTEYNMYDEFENLITTYPLSDEPGPYDTTEMRTYFPGERWNDNFRQSIPTFAYVFDVQDPNCCPYQDSIKFNVRHILKNLTGGPGIGTVIYDSRPANDTVHRLQSFYNYYAYDDGEAEASMYLGLPGSIAYEFDLNYPDTLRAIQMYFNPQDPDITVYSFRLSVWKTLANGATEDTLYTQGSVRPQYNGIAPNQFTTYILERPVPLPAGKFYIGWKQFSQFYMNIGYDKNIDRSDKMFYKTSGEWQSFDDLSSTQYDGALMMRPVLGKSVNYNDFVDIEEPETEATTVSLYPNPSQGIFYYNIHSVHNAAMDIHVLDIGGKTVFTGNSMVNPSIDLGHLGNGIYFARFTSKDKTHTSVHKLILSR